MSRRYTTGALFLSVIVLFLVTTRVALAEDQQPRIPKSMILVIGDGMGPQQIALQALYAREFAGFSDAGFTLGKLMREGVVGVVNPAPINGLVADSACTATSLASGEESLVGTLGLNEQGEPIPTILELAKDAGKAVGLVSDTRLTHATPAAFAVHVAYRRLENLIAEQLLKSGTDVMLSGGLRHFVSDASIPLALPFDVESSRSDARDLLAEARELGYSLAFEKETLESYRARKSKVLGLFSASGMMNGIEYRRTRDDPDRREPSLLEMSEFALETLSKNSEGFFLMIEAGQIDWAGHANDAGWLLAEMQKLEETLHFLRKWVARNQDTLLVVTADHETGSFGLSYSSHNIPEKKPLLSKTFKEQVAGYYQLDYNFGGKRQLEVLRNQKKTLSELIEDYEKLSFWRRGIESLRTLVLDTTGLSLSREQASRVLSRQSNPFRILTHSQLSDEYVPDLGALSAFYPYPRNAHTALLARELAARQGVVWATGTHTSTPVLVAAKGPAEERFRGYFSLAELGKLLIDSLIQSEEPPIETAPESKTPIITVE